MDIESSAPLVQCLNSFNAHSDKIWAVAWHPAGEIFATCSSDKSIRIWSLIDISVEGEKKAYKCELKQSITDVHERTVRSLAFSPDGKMLASGSFDSTISIFALNNGQYQSVAKLEGHDNEVKCVAWDSTGKYLASCSRDKTVWVWDYEDGFEFSCYAVLDAHTQDVKHVQWVPNTSNLVSSSFDDTLKLWQSEDDDWILSHSYTHHSSIVWAVAFSHDGRQMASCSDDRTVKIYTRQSNEDGPMYLLDTTIPDAHARSIYSVAFSYDSTFLASVGGDNSLNVYQKNMDRGLEECGSAYELLEKKVGCHFGDINGVAFHPSKDLVITVSDDRFVKLWSVEMNL